MSDENKAAELETYLDAIDAAAFKEYKEREAVESINDKLEEWYKNALLYGISFLMLNSKGEVRALKPEEYSHITSPKLLVANDEPVDNA